MSSIGRWVLMFPFLLACTDPVLADVSDGGGEDLGPLAGSISGRVCDPSGRGWLPNAAVYTYLFDDAGTLTDTRRATTDQAGAWTLEDLPGEREYTVYVQLGSEILSTEVVPLGDGEVLTLDPPACLDPLDLRVAVVTGDYDDTQVVLERLGLADYDVVDGSDGAALVDFLLDTDAMAPYDVIFFNGGHVEEGVVYVAEDPKTGEMPDSSVPEAVLLNLRTFVQQGGMLYASDWAYDLIERAWPDRLDFAGDDGVPDDAQRGVAANVIGTVRDGDLAERLGTTTVEIEFDLPGWPPIEQSTSGVTVYVSGAVSYEDDAHVVHTIDDAPLLIGFGEGTGQLFFSSWRVAKNHGDDTAAILAFLLDQAGDR